MKIVIITGSDRPIPATCGGATQTMMTHLLDVNETEKRNNFIVYSFYEVEAEKKSHKYKHSAFRYYHSNRRFDTLCGLPTRFLRKVSGGRTYIKTNFVRWCIKQINMDNPDAVIIEGNYFQTLQLAKAISCPIILHMHIDGLHTQTDNAKSIVDVCTGIFAISDYCRKRISAIDFKQADKVITVKNTIDVEHFNSLGRESAAREIRKKYGIAPDDIVFVYCGRVDDTKGVREAIQAFIELDRENTAFFVIGSSAYKDGKKNDYFRALEKMSGDRGKKIIFTGYVSQDELPNYYAASAISMVPSKCQEAAGNVTIEAMACGLPVITTTQGGIPEYADRKACILVKVDEHFVDSLKTAMAELLDNKKLYEQMRNNAREISLQYDKSHYYDHFCDAVDKVLGGDSK